MQSYIRKNTWKSTENKGSNRILLLWTRVGILMSFLKHKLTCEVKSQSHLQPKWDCFKGRVWEQLRFPHFPGLLLKPVDSSWGLDALMERAGSRVEG